MTIRAGFYAVFRTLSRMYGPAVFISALPPLFSSLLMLGGWVISGRVELDKYLYQLLGMSLLIMAQVALSEISWTLKGWIDDGLFEYLQASPAQPLSVFIGVFLAESLIFAGLSLIITAAVVGAIKGPLFALSTLAAFALAFLGSLPLVGLGMALASLVLFTKEPGVVAMPIGALMAVAGGVLYPTSILPPYLHYIAEALPMAALADVVRGLALGLVLPIKELGALGGYAFYILIGVLSFDAVGRVARRRGIA